MDINDEADSQRWYNACKRNDLRTVNRILSEGEAPVPCPGRRTSLHYAALGNSKQVGELLLNRGADPNARDDNNVTPLHIAAEYQYKGFVNLLINHKADVNAEDDKQRTVLYIAVITGNKDIVKLLLSNGAVPNRSNTHTNVSDFPRNWNDPFESTDYVCRSALLNAAKKNSIKMVKLLINYGADLNFVDNYKRTAMFYAIVHSNVTMVELLLRKGANVTNDLDLLHNAMYVNCARIVELLLDAGISVDIVNSKSRMGLSLHTERMVTHFGMAVNISDLAKQYETGKIKIAKMLLSRGYPINLRDIFEQTALHCAAGKGYIKLVKVLLTYNPNVNARDVLDKTPLHHSANVIISRMLIKHGADINVFDKFGVSPLHNAAKDGDIEIVETLLQFEPDVNAQNELGMTPLHLSTNADISRLLLENGANPDVASGSRETALHVAVRQGDLAIVRILLEFKADIHVRDQHGRTPIYYAEDLRILRMLIRNGANVNNTSTNHETPLHYASQNGRVEIATVLLAFKADPMASNRSTLTPLHQSTDSLMTQILLHEGADVNASTDEGETPLHIAAHRGYLDIAKVLVEYKADVNSRDMINATPLHKSVEFSQVAMTEMLLKKGAVVNAKDIDGRTPLHEATNNCTAPVIKLLLNYDADINCADHSGRTPIFNALQYGKVRIFQLFLDGDADINHCMKNDTSILDRIGELSIHNSRDFRVALVEHIKKIKALNRFVSDENLIAMNNYDRECKSNLYNRLKEEVERMRQHKLESSNLSPYDLLTKSVTQIAIFVTRKDKASDVEIWQSTITKEYIYPLYYDMIVFKLEEVSRKVQSWKHSGKCLRLILSQWLTPDETGIILPYLGDKDLQTLSRMYVECFKD